MNTQKSLVRGLAASIAFGSFFAGLSMAASVAMLAKVTPTLISPFGLILSGVPDMTMWIMFAIIAALLAVIPMIVIKKVTDADEVKKTFATASMGLWIVVGLNVLLMIATIFVSLFSLGIEGMSENAAEEMQEKYWLGTFVPSLLSALINATAAVFLRMIAKGKLALMNVYKIVNIVIASVVVAMMIISSLVALHPKSGSGVPSNYDLQTLLRVLGD